MTRPSSVPQGFSRKEVLAAVNFDCQPLFMAIEVQDERTDWVLALELHLRQVFTEAAP
jgi:hypothetical protein